VHVYCVETEVRVTPCDVYLDADAGHSRAELRRWWLRAARALHDAGTFHHEGRDWRFADVLVAEPSSLGGLITYGWRCPGDQGHSPERVWGSMLDRMPGRAHGIATLAAAHKRGCTFAASPL